MEALNLEKRPYTVEEYFALQAKSQHKLEYVNGSIRMMAGGTANHNRICKNAFRQMDRNPNGCEVFLSETAISLSESNRYYYPDLSAICAAEIEQEDTKMERILNPCLIVEVLSDSTAEQDRAEKFQAYRRLPSFREYLLIDSRKQLAETFYREANDLWHIRSYFKDEHLVEVKTLGLDIPLRAFFEGVVFEEG